MHMMERNLIKAIYIVKIYLVPIKLHRLLMNIMKHAWHGQVVMLAPPQSGTLLYIMAYI